MDETSSEQLPEQLPKRELPKEMEPYKWQAGQSGNPGGRPKRTYLTEVTEEMLKEKLSDPEGREQFKQAQWAKLLSKGVVSAMTLDKIWERMEGKVTQPVEHSGNLTLLQRMDKARERATEDDGTS